ncbi:unnamed protein product [Protopolystoma xenopodis]|uniref:FZ domain-containing protein n=1 Tax=Protopolystoma xenopodis TaxID=117903 RepID=A0A3S5A5B9_9PLAT|nr:unnamed protein product [Protopolystoma xenopodis]
MLFPFVCHLISGLDVSSGEMNSDGSYLPSTINYDKHCPLPREPTGLRFQKVGKNAATFLAFLSPVVLIFFSLSACIEPAHARLGFQKGLKPAILSASSALATDGGPRRPNLLHEKGVYSLISRSSHSQRDLQAETRDRAYASLVRLPDLRLGNLQSSRRPLRSRSLLDEPAVVQTSNDASGRLEPGGFARPESVLESDENKRPEKCIPLEIAMCRQLGYNLTYMPNFFNHESQAEAEQKASLY